MTTGLRRTAALRSLLALGFACALGMSSRVEAAYAIAQFGTPKYPQGFAHFDYVNADAPKGGTLVLANPSRLTSFDKFNPFTMRGNAFARLRMPSSANSDITGLASCA